MVARMTTPAAFLPPEDVEVVTLGACVLGYRHDPTGRKKMSRVQGRAATRLSHLDALARLRARDGIMLADPLGWLDIVVDALSELAGFGHWRLTSKAVRRFLPQLEQPLITMEAIEGAMTAPRRPGRIIPDGDAGVLIGLCDAERAELEEQGVVVTMHPVDETDDARASRRANRERILAASRQKECRRRRKDVAAKSVTPRNVTLPHSKVTFSTVTVHSSTLMDRDSRNVTFRANKAPAAVMAAVVAGCSTVKEIAVRTGFPAGRIKMALKRLCQSGLIVKLARGRYSPCRRRTEHRLHDPIIARRLTTIRDNVQSIAARLSASAAPVSAMAARLSAAARSAELAMEERDEPKV